MSPVITRHDDARFSALATLAQELDLPGQATPFLVLDLDAMERNIAKMSSWFQGRSAGLRPHLKHHKCTEIARLQVAAGATGITCATSDEVAAAVKAGIGDVLLANVVTDRVRLASLADSALRADVTIAVDSEAAARLASSAAMDRGARFRVVVEVDIGMRRSGVSSVPEAVGLARRVVSLPGLSFRGIMAYEGHLVAMKDRAERDAAVLAAFEPIEELLDALARSDLEVTMVTGGAAATYEVAGSLSYMTDVQAGSYVLMDAVYSELVPEFEVALSVVATVATARPGRPVVVDVGAKRISTDWGLPVLAGFEAQHYAVSEEHNRFVVDGPRLPEVGERVAVVPGHGCSTVSFYRSIMACRNNRFEKVLTVDARDALAQ